VPQAQSEDLIQDKVEVVAEAAEPSGDEAAIIEQAVEKGLQPGNNDNGPVYDRSRQQEGVGDWILGKRFFLQILLVFPRRDDPPRKNG
jgi:hypothetical protein